MQIDPWSAVHEELTQPAPATPAAVTPAQDVRPTVVISAGARARPGSVCLLKEHSIAGRQLYAVAFEGLDGHPQRYLIGVEEEPSGWVTCGGRSLDAGRYAATSLDHRSSGHARRPAALVGGFGHHVSGSSATASASHAWALSGLSGGTGNRRSAYACPPRIQSMHVNAVWVRP